MPYHNDTIIKVQWQRQTQEDFFNNILPLILLQGFEKGYLSFASETELETEHKLLYFDPTVTAVSVVSFSFSRAAQPEAQDPLCWVMAFFIASYQHLLWTPTRQGPRPLRPGVAFPTTSRPFLLQLSATQLAWLSYIIVQRPLDRPLGLWNRMFNRHQAEKNVMQFRGHSLPVRQSMRVSWDFLARPISSVNFRPRDFLS